MYNAAVMYREATPQLDVFSLFSHEQAMTRVVKGIIYYKQGDRLGVVSGGTRVVWAMLNGIGTRKGVHSLIRC